MKYIIYTVKLFVVLLILNIAFDLGYKDGFEDGNVNLQRRLDVANESWMDAMPLLCQVVPVTRESTCHSMGGLVLTEPTPTGLRWSCNVELKSIIK